jgi:hypothetical protein
VADVALAVRRRKCGASQLAVPAIGFTSFDQRQPGWEDQSADLPAADVQDLSAAARELAGLVRLLEALVLCLSMSPPVRNRKGTLTCIFGSGGRI